MELKSDYTDFNTLIIISYSMKPLHCKVCGYEWYSRTPIKPRVCSKCKSFNWEKGKGNKKKKVKDELSNI